MPSSLGSIGRKIRSLFRRRTDARRSPLRSRPEDQPAGSAAAMGHPPSPQAMNTSTSTPTEGLTLLVSANEPESLLDPQPGFERTQSATKPQSGTEPGTHSTAHQLGGSSTAEEEPLLVSASLSIGTGIPSPPAFGRGAESESGDGFCALDNLNQDPAVTPAHGPSGSSPLHAGSPQLPITPPAFSPLPQLRGHDILSSSPTIAGSASYFPNARDFQIQNQQINTVTFASSKTLFEHLDPHIAHGAAHDSSERCDAPACHEETRVAIRQNIMSWIKHGEGGDEPQKIMWLSGPAGAGKTAIAGSVAESCKEEGILAATFMFSSFSGSMDRRLKRGFVATLAYHMSQHEHLGLFQTHLLAAIERRPDIFHKNLKEQAEHLVLGPFRRMDGQGDRGGWPKVVIVDGLDEVIAPKQVDPTGQQPPRTPEEDQLEILKVLLTLSRSPCFPFRIFIASRPERHITEFFSADALQTRTLSLFLDDKYEPDADIRLFLKSKFADIRRRHWISDAQWPGNLAIRRLVYMSSGQFIVPTTVLRWVEAGIPEQQLDEILELKTDTPGPSNPFASLDAVYRHILLRGRTPDSDPLLVIKWIRCITSRLVRSPFHMIDTTPALFWRIFLEDRAGELDFRTAPIASLISVPPPNDMTSSIALHHKSFSDFVSTEARCGDLFVNMEELDYFFCERIFAVLKDQGHGIVRSLTGEDMRRFMADFMTLINVYGVLKDNGNLDSFLFYLSDDSKANLTSCDVAWWTSATLEADIPTFGPTLVATVYATIHRAMKCRKNIVHSQDANPARRGRRWRCHEACTYWRTGILSRAKEIGWCVHELEKGDFYLLTLGNVTSQLLRKMDKQPDGSFVHCEGCNPTVDST